MLDTEASTCFNMFQSTTVSFTKEKHTSKGTHGFIGCHNLGPRHKWWWSQESTNSKFRCLWNNSKRGCFQLFDLPNGRAYGGQNIHQYYLVPQLIWSNVLSESLSDMGVLCWRSSLAGVLALWSFFFLFLLLLLLVLLVGGVGVGWWWCWCCWWWTDVACAMPLPEHKQKLLLFQASELCPPYHICLQKAYRRTTGCLFLDFHLLWPVLVEWQLPQKTAVACCCCNAGTANGGRVVYFSSAHGKETKGMSLLTDRAAPHLAGKRMSEHIPNGHRWKVKPRISFQVYLLRSIEIEWTSPPLVSIFPLSPLEPFPLGPKAYDPTLPQVTSIHIHQLGYSAPAVFVCLAYRVGCCCFAPSNWSNKLKCKEYDVCQSGFSQKEEWRGYWNPCTFGGRPHQTNNCIHWNSKLSEACNILTHTQDAQGSSNLPVAQWSPESFV